jgi:pre-mRNA-splicing factor CWC26
VVAGDDRPLVDVDVEVKRMRRLEVIRDVRSYNAIGEDGSRGVHRGSHGEWGASPLPEQHAFTGAGRRSKGTLSPKRNGVAEQGDLSPSWKSRQQVDL